MNASLSMKLARTTGNSATASVRGPRSGSLKHVGHVNRQVSRWRVLVRAEAGDEATGSTGSTPSSVEDADDEPVWVKREKQRELDAQNKDLPFGVYLLFSSIVCIAAVGSIFEFANHNPIFGVIEADSPFYAPILGAFAITGIPTSGLLFFKGVAAANAEAERMDAMDGVVGRDSVLNPRKEE